MGETREAIISIHTILSITLTGGGIVYLGACLGALSGHFRRGRQNPGYTPTVSVIVPARNEESTIGALLDDLTGQDYPADRIEIIVIDDRSDDGTPQIVENRILRDNRIRLIDTRNATSPYTHKKRAVNEGIMASTGEVIMTTDADCRVPERWITGMTERFADGVDLVAGEVIVEGGGLHGMAEALELIGIQTMAAGFMKAGFPITCNGANLAYRRSAFDRAGGFADIGHIISGDDDLLMQKIAGNDPSRVVFSTGRQTAVRTDAAESTKLFLQSRARWASKITGYPSKSAVGLLAVFFAYFIALLVQPALIAAGTGSVLPFAAGMGMKLAGDLLLTTYGTWNAGRPGLMLLFLPAELLHIPYIIAVTVWGTFGTFVWQGRKTSAVSAASGEHDHAG